MRVLITGIAGFIGSHLASHLAEAGHEVHGLALQEDPELAGFPVEVADVRDAGAVAGAISRSRPEAIVHLAGLSRPRDPSSSPETFLQVNVEGTRHLVRALEGRALTRLVLASSGQVYGRVEERHQPISEDHPRHPRGDYALSKAAAEDVVLAYPGGIVVRSFNTIGRGQPEGFAIPDFAHRLAAIRAGKLARFQCGNLDAKLDFLHVDDAVEGYRLVLERGEPGEIYNLASCEAHQMRALLEQLLEISGVETEVLESTRPAYIQLLEGDNRRLVALGWERRHGVREALQDLWDEVSGGAGSVY